MPAATPKPAAAPPREPHERLEPEPASYEAALTELEVLVRALEAKELPLDQLLSSHRRGAALLAWCRSRLQVVEQQVQVFEDGQIKPFAT